MDTEKSARDHSGAGLILAGLALALLGSGSVMLLVIGVSSIYVGRYTLAFVELAGFVLGGGFFLRSYGPYLARLEKRAPMDADTALPHDPSVPRRPPDDEAEHLREAAPDEPIPAEAEGHEEQSLSEPLPMGVVVSLATGIYGVLVTAVGLIGTRGVDLLLNVVAGGALMMAAGLVWSIGRRSSESQSND